LERAGDDAGQDRAAHNARDADQEKDKILPPTRWRGSGCAKGPHLV
jgi:hypothetical protein